MADDQVFDRSMISRNGRGAITAKEWDALKRSIIFAVCACNPYYIKPWFVELGLLSCRTSRAIVKELALFDCRIPFLGVDKRKIADEIVMDLRKIYSNVYIDQGLSYDVGKGDDGAVAWVFVDACHCEGCVARDIAAWAPRVINGGILAFHDADERNVEAKMAVHPSYHDDAHSAEKRRYGVTTAIEKSNEMKNFELMDKVPAMRRVGKNVPPYFGGLKIYRKKNA